MGVIFLNRETNPDFKRRIDRIEPAAKPRFGKLTPAAMLRHLRYELELALGEQEEKDISNVLTRTVGRWLFLHVFTNWPKGKIKAPASLTPEPDGDLEYERVKLFEAMDRYITLLESDPARIAPHPVFGPITVEYWSRLNGLHFEHHMKQYGA